MRRTKGTRLEAVRREIEAVPIKRDVVEPAFARFRATGELPNHRQLAIDVIRWAEVGSANVRKHGGSLFIAEEYKRAYALIDDPDAWRRPKPLRYYLFREALGNHEVERVAARCAIRAMVDLGRDVEDPDFVCPTVGEPEFVSVGMHLLGFPGAVLRGRLRGAGAAVDGSGPSVSGARHRPWRGVARSVVGGPQSRRSSNFRRNLTWERGPVGNRRAALYWASDRSINGVSTVKSGETPETRIV